MPTGYEFSQELKQLAFNVIKFVKNEKNGPVIPLNNVNDRLQSMLGISLVLVKRLKQEMREEQERMMEEKRAIDQEKRAIEQAKRDKDNQAAEATRRLRHPRSPTAASTYSPTDNTGYRDACCSSTTKTCSFGSSAYCSFRTRTREYPVSEY